jgi:MinD superfamily P-loop ATPase
LVCINKADLDPAGATTIEAFCQGHGLPVVGQLLFDTVVTEAMVQGQPVTAFDPDSAISQALYVVWKQVLQVMGF